jgi:HEAT repeat protein
MRLFELRELVEERKTEKLIELYCNGVDIMYFNGVDIISGVIQQFTAGNYTIRKNAAYIFGKIGKRYPEEVKDGISKLASLLVDKEKDVHNRAFEALIEIGMKRPDLVVGTIPAMVRYSGFPEIANDLKELVSSDFESAKVVTSNLVSLLYDDKDKVREIAAFALGVIGEERPELVKNAIPPLMNLLKEGKNVNVCFVSFTLGSIGENRPEWVKNAIPKLVKILKKSKSEEFTIIIASAIGNIGRNEPEKVREAIHKLISLLGYRLYDYYYHTLNRNAIEIRVTAAEALIKIGKFGEERGKVISKIKDLLLAEEDAYAREKGSLFLGALKEYPETKEAIPLLVKLLDDPCWRVRGAAAFALGEIEEVVSDPKSLRSLADGTPLLTRLLGDDKAWVRLSAAYALSEIGGVEALEELKKLENDNERSKIWYLGEEKEFEVKSIVNEAEEKIEARLEGREIRPELNVSLSKTKFKKEVQNAVLFVENKGKVSARDIEIVFPDVLRVKGLREFSLRAGESRKLELEVEPKEVGMLSLTIAISFSDFKGNEYGSTEKIELEVEKVAITPERVAVGEKGVIIERTIYDPCKRDFIEKPLPRMKQWINSHDPGAYWFVVSLQNSSDNIIEGWDVELETSSALKIEEAKIEGFEIEIPHEAHLGSFKISVPKEYGIVIPKRGAQRVYFKLRAEKPKTMYEISGVFKSKITGEVPIRAKEFKYLCDAGMPPEAVKAELKKTFSEKEAARLALSFKTVQELDRMCNQDAKTEEYLDKLLSLKEYTKGFREKFTTQVDEFSRFMEQEQMGYLDNKYKEKVRRFCTNLVDAWISEFLKG